MPLGTNDNIKMCFKICLFPPPGSVIGLLLYIVSFLPFIVMVAQEEDVSIVLKVSVAD